MMNPNSTWRTNAPAFAIRSHLMAGGKTPAVGSYVRARLSIFRLAVRHFRVAEHVPASYLLRHLVRPPRHDYPLEPRPEDHLESGFLAGEERQRRIPTLLYDLEGFQVGEVGSLVEPRQRQVDDESQPPQPAVLLLEGLFVIHHG